jgi:primosomal protein N' (replication factor Y)
MTNSNLQFAEIAVPTPVNQLFTYSIPDNFQEAIQPGMRVLVPFGKKQLTGYVVRLSSTTAVKELKSIIDILDEQPAFSNELLELAQWIGDYYLCSTGEALKAMLPTGINIESEQTVTLKPDENSLFPEYISTSSKSFQSRILAVLVQEGEQSLKQLQKKVGIKGLYYNVGQLVHKNRIQLSSKLLEAQVKPKLIRFVQLKSTFSDEIVLNEVIEKLKIKSKQRSECLHYLRLQKQAIPVIELVQACKISGQLINSVAQEGLIEITYQEVLRSLYGLNDEIAPLQITLNVDQEQALDEISTHLKTEQFKVFLLHGVTGSGKTQVYIEALKKLVARGKGGIVLVPEISLTPQTVRRFQANFPGQVAVLHSRMSPGERYDSWRKLKDGTFRIAIGARSAIFAPIEKIGIIIVDEEHEASYKQFESNPLYHARDVAVVRAKLNQAIVLLGSATPSIESYHNALTGKYHLLKLPRRIDDIPMPDVKIIDLMREHRVYGYDLTTVFSIPLKKKIQEKLDKGEQIILLQNRRGHSPFVRCKECGFIEQCVHCNITLTYHKKGNHLRCHYCGYSRPISMKCPQCGKEELIFKGVGTQKVEEELKKLFPETRVVRMDLDTTSGKLAHDRIIIDFGNGKYDILLGTQMVAKGLDFHRVSLVGVISADTGLFIPDFHASERTFQLLTQVAGRPGRKGAQGEVLIQTYSPDNPCLIYAQKHNYEGFYAYEERARKELNYPPYGKMIAIYFKGLNENEVAATARKFRQILDARKVPFDILGPAPSPITKIENNYRWQIALRSPRSQDPTGSTLKQFVREANGLFQKYLQRSKIKMIIDVDPISMF